MKKKKKMKLFKANGGKKLTDAQKNTSFKAQMQEFKAKGGVVKTLKKRGGKRGV